MFNTPILDVAIGLIFVFLIYSLLATSVKEAIATTFSLRAKMLKRGIVESMLSDTPKHGRLQSILIGIAGFFTRAFHRKGHNLGDKFYNHPLLRNYGSSRVFPHPSYLPADNFCTVLLDVLKKDFHEKREAIAEFKSGKPASDSEHAKIKNELELLPDAEKIKQLLEFYGAHYSGKLKEIHLPIIDKDTWEILQMHLQNSFYNLEKFSKKLEEWFDDTMARVAGWYKRQSQVILFFIGIMLAIVFNIDSIEISNNLSKDKNLREQMVKMAIASVEVHKNDPRVNRDSTEKQQPKNITAEQQPKDTTEKQQPNDTTQKQQPNDTTEEQQPKNSTEEQQPEDSTSLEQAQENLKKLQNEFEGEAKKLNTLMAVGWDDYGMKNNCNSVIKEYQGEYDTLRKSMPDSIALRVIYDTHWIRLKAGHVVSEAFRGKKFLGLLITAFAICLGAPFWFDMLSKIVKLRGAGKKEDGDDSNSQQPVTINLNTQNGAEPKKES